MIQIEYGGHPEDPELMATAQHYKDFKKSFVWTDIRNYLSGRIEIATGDLITASSMDAVRILQGEIRTLKSLLELPDQLLREAQQKQEETHGTDSGTTAD